MTTARTFTVTVHNEYTFADGYTIDDVRRLIGGFDCSRECESISLVVDSIEEVKTDG